MNQQEKEAIIREFLANLTPLFAKNNITWWIGGGSSLLMHGFDIEIHDLDIAIAKKDFDRAKTLVEKIPHCATIRNNDTRVLQCTYHTLEIDFPSFGKTSIKDLINVTWHGLTVYTHPLEKELEFYKARTDKKEQNTQRIQMLKKRLGIKK